MRDLRKQLKKLDACKEGMDWLADQEAATAWAACERGEWMLWVASRVGVDLKTLTLAKVRCARLVQHRMTYQRSLDALDVAERFAAGDATREELDRAAAAATDAWAEAAYSYSAYSAAAYSALRQCADICRSTIPFDLIIAGLKEQGE